MTFFIQIPVTTDPSTLADNAVERLRARWDGWEPNDGDLEVIQIETLAPMAADAAEAVSRVPAAIWREFGTKLYGLTYRVAAAATGLLTVQTDGNGPYLIPAGTEVNIDGYAFAFNTDLSIPAGTTSVPGVQVTARTAGVAANGLTGSVIAPLTALSFRPTFTLPAPTSGGVDEETDDEYQDRLVRNRQLGSRSLIVARDWEYMALEDPRVTRALAVTDSTRTTNITVLGPDGLPAPDAAKTSIGLMYDFYKSVNAVYAFKDPLYTTVNVTYSVKLEPGAIASQVLAQTNEAVASLLSPANWGTPSSARTEIGLGTNLWNDDPVVRKNKLIDIIADIDGVDYVNDVTLTGSTPGVTGAAVVSSTGNLTMPTLSGRPALPVAGTISGSYF